MTTPGHERDETEMGSLLSQAEALVRENRVDEALDVYDEMLGIDPANLLALEQEATLKATSGDIDGALIVHDKIIELFPNDLSRLEAKGDLLVAVGRYDEAIVVFSQGAEVDPDDHTWLQRIGDAYRGKASMAPSDPTFEASLAAAIAALDKAIDISPDESELWIDRGDALLDIAEIDEAIEAFEEASRLDADQFSEVDWNTRADRSFTAEDYPTAIRLYEKANEAKPNAASWRGIGLANQASGDMDRALAAYEAGLELEPLNVVLMNDKGVILLNLGRHTEAREAFSNVVDHDPTFVYAHLNVGYLNRLEGSLEEARTSYQRALDLDPDNADTWVDLGMCDLELGDDEQALRSFEKATSVDANSFWGWNNRGFVLFRLGRQAEAIEYYDRAIEIDPHEVTPWSNKVGALAEMGQIDSAGEVAHQALEKVTSRPHALATQAVYLTEWADDDQGAIAALEEAIALEPDPALLVSLSANLAEVYLKVGRDSESRELAEKVLEGEVEIEIRCALLFVIFATHAVTDDRSSARHQAFDAFIAFYRDNFVIGNRQPLEWNYRRLSRTLGQRGLPQETMFVLQAAMDLQLGQVRADDLSFFRTEMDTAAP